MPSGNACGCCCKSRATPLTVFASARLGEPLVALLEEGWVGPVAGSVRHNQMISLETLESVLQHRTVDLGEHVVAHLEHQVGPDAHDVHVEHRVVQLAEGEAIGTAGDDAGLGPAAEGVEPVQARLGAGRDPDRHIDVAGSCPPRRHDTVVEQVGTTVTSGPMASTQRYASGPALDPGVEHSGPGRPLVATRRMPRDRPQAPLT